MFNFNSRYNISKSALFKNYVNKKNLMSTFKL